MIENSHDPAGPPSPRIRLRAVENSDRDFLRRVYASTREDELAAVEWSDAQKLAFIEQQYAAQDLAYTNNYPGAEFRIVVVDGSDAGRLYIHRRSDEIRIMDIALLPRFRRLGVGTRLLRDVMAEGAAARRRVTIHVETFNPALRLYQRLGFVEIGKTHVYLLLEWKPAIVDSEAGLTGPSSGAFFPNG